MRWAGTSGTKVDDDVALVPTDGTRFTLLFVPTSDRKTGPNRLHLDLTTTSLDDQQESVERLIALGARHIDIGQRPDEPHVVLADPEGNELCLIEPGNTFLAGCGRLGSITCDGTREVGLFWSAALGWPLVWDQDEETAIRAPDGTGPLITWGGPPVAPKSGPNRLHLDIAPPTDGRPGGGGRPSRLPRRERVDTGRGDVDRVVMTDPDGNELCVLSPR